MLGGQQAKAKEVVRLGKISSRTFKHDDSNGDESNRTAVRATMKATVTATARAAVKVAVRATSTPRIPRITSRFRSIG